MYQDYICTGDMGGACGSTYEAKSYGRSMYGSFMGAMGSYGRLITTDQANEGHGIKQWQDCSVPEWPLADGVTLTTGGMGGYGSTYGAGSQGSSMYGRPMGAMGSYGGYGSSMGGNYGSSYGSSMGGGMYGRPYGGYNSYGSGVGGGYMGAPYGAGAQPGPPGRSLAT